MPTFRMTSAALVLPLLLSACGGGNLEVRDGPQAVHPSPSNLAQNIVTESPCSTAYHHCKGYHKHHHHHHHYTGNDGSQPIVD